MSNDLTQLINQKIDLLCDLERATAIPKNWDKFTESVSSINGVNGDVFTLKINGDNVPQSETTVVRCCGCGRVIPNPRRGQRFCSAKVVGYSQAHRCRNMVSNPRNNTKRSFVRIVSDPVLFNVIETIRTDRRRFLFN